MRTIIQIAASPRTPSPEDFEHETHPAPHLVCVTTDGQAWWYQWIPEEKWLPLQPVPDNIPPEDYA